MVAVADRNVNESARTRKTGNTTLASTNAISPRSGLQRNYPLTLALARVKRRAEAKRRLGLEPLFPEVKAEFSLDVEAVLERFFVEAEEDDKVNPTGIAWDAVPYMIEILPYYAVRIQERGRLPEEAILGLGLDAWLRMYGTKVPVHLGFTPEVVDRYLQVLNTARLLLIAARNATPRGKGHTHPKT